MNRMKIMANNSWMPTYPSPLNHPERYPLTRWHHIERSAIMNITARNLARAMAILIALISTANCEEDRKAPPKPTVYEMMLVPLLNVLGVEYDKADEPRRREIEYSAYLANRTYWLQTQKLGDQEGSEIVENYLGSLNAKLFSSQEFERLLSDWKTHYGDKFPTSATSYTATTKDGQEHRLRIGSYIDWTKLHAELHSFMKGLASRYEDRVRRALDSNDSNRHKNQAVQGGAGQPATNPESKSEGKDKPQSKKESTPR